MRRDKETATKRPGMVAAELGHLAAPVSEGAIFPFAVAKSNIKGGSVDWHHLKAARREEARQGQRKAVAA
jgi:hypothetical protein